MLGAEAFSPGLIAVEEEGQGPGGIDLPSDREEALAWHEKGRQRVERLVHSASAADAGGEGSPTRADLLRNSVEWIKEGTIELFSVSPTHDSEERAGEGKVAYFDRRRTYDEGGATYDADPARNGGVEEVMPRGGHMDGNALVVFDAHDQSESDLANTLIHEVQHYADKGPDKSFQPDQGGRGFAPYVAPRWAFHQYQSEFRARVVDPVRAPDFGSPDNVAPEQLTFRATRRAEDVDKKTPAVEVQKTDVFSEQVSLVLRDMVRDPSIERWVDYKASGHDRWLANYAYLPHYYVFDPIFRAMVNSYADRDGPTGGNMVNSVRIQALAKAIQQQDIADVRWRATLLDGIDLAFLRNREQSDPFWSLVEKRLHPMEAAWLSSFVKWGGGGEESAYQQVATVEGDTLSLLCERYLGDPGRWTEVYEMNREVIGSSPDVLRVGLMLRMPRS